MAYKDEYEVARLYTDGTFLKQVANEFGGDNLRFEFHLAPPLLAKINPATGEPRKMSFGPWMMSAFGCWRRFKSCAARRSTSSAIPRSAGPNASSIADYEAMLDEVLGQAHARQSSARGRPCRDPGEDPRLRPRQGAPPRRRQGRRGRAAGAVPLRQAAAAEGGGIRRSSAPDSRGDPYCVAVMLLARITSPQSLISLLSSAAAVSGRFLIGRKRGPCRRRRKSF